MIVAALLVAGFAAVASGQVVAPPVVDPPPAPAALTVEGVTVARDALGAWRTATRARIGPYYSANGQGVLIVSHPLPNLTGYFAVLGDRGERAGVVQGTWSEPSGERPIGSFSGVYLNPYTVCEAGLPLQSVHVDALVFLGAERNAAIDALDAALAPIADRTITGGPLQGGDGSRIVAYDGAPTGGMVERFYPMRALERAMPGTVTLNCLVQQDRALRCGVVSADPAGWGFEDGALRIMQHPQVRMAATADNGQPSAGKCIRRRVSFRLG